MIGQAVFPKPRPAAIGQTLRPEEAGQWVEVEGKVTFVSEEPDGLKLELSAGTGRLRAEVANSAGLSSALLLNRRVRAVGFGQSATTSDGRTIPGILLVPSGHEITYVEMLPDGGRKYGDQRGELPLLVNAAKSIA